ncbi:hypothetical protein DB347_17585 [Opitutaceae bacterium EW11]|nr:hypothetical protein DB347_17585 [Opitutaceae bacterium EW11]
MNAFRLAFRSLSQAPVFSLTVVVTLALGIGSASAIFSVVDRALFRPLPYAQPDQLFTLGYEVKNHGFQEWFTAVEASTYRERSKSVAAFAIHRASTENLVDHGTPAGVNVAYVSADYFSTFGVLPILGRAFVSGEDRAGANNVLVLTHKLWKQRFGGDPAVIGRDVLLGDAPCRIVGVLPADFQQPRMHVGEVYRPLVLQADPAQPFAHGFIYWIIARLKPGVTPQQAQAELATFKIETSSVFDALFADRKPEFRPLEQWTSQQSSTSNWMLLGAVGLLYVIACTNAANLVLARLHGRRRELCIRLALGGGRRQIVQLVVAETLILAGTAAVGSLFIARWVFPLLLWLVRSDTTVQPLYGMDARVMLVTAGYGVLTVLLICVPLTWRLSRSNLSAVLKEGAQTVGETPSLRRVRSVLVVLETAIAVVLLIGAGLMVRTVHRLQHFDRGIDPNSKASLMLTFPSEPQATIDGRRAFLLEADRRLREIPGVQAVAAATAVPMSNMWAGWNLVKPDGTEISVGWNAVAPEYRATLNLPIVRGRWFDDARPTDAQVVVINETLARQYFGTENPVGQTFRFDPNDKKALPWQVMGVARDVRSNVRGAVQPEFYFPFWQTPAAVGQYQMLLLRLSKPIDEQMNAAACRAIYAINPLIATMPLRPLSDAVVEQMAHERATLTFLKALSGLALGLAVTGLFAVMAFSVAQRSVEFGVRMALGASPGDVFRLVLTRGAMLAVAGAALGSAVAWGGARLIQAVLFETNPLDPIVYVSVALILVLAAVLGCLLPARLAMRVDLAALLRAE